MDTLDLIAGNQARSKVTPLSDAVRRLDDMAEHRFPVLVALSPAGAWRQLWLKYVTGFDPSCHCQKCLMGAAEGALYRRLQPGVPMPLASPRVGSSYDALYLCGVHASWNWGKNLHLVAIPDPHATAAVTAGDGDEFRIYGARLIPIPDLPLGFAGKGKEFTTCRNWRFGMAYYGPDPRRRAFDPLGQRSGLLAT